jgi:hypothetical protein
MDLRREINSAAAEVATWAPGIRMSMNPPAILESMSTAVLRQALRLLRVRVKKIEAVLAARDS